MNGDGTWTAFWDVAPFGLGSAAIVLIIAVVTRRSSPSEGDPK